MDETERITIRIKRILLRQARDIAYNNNISVDEVINMLILNGIQNISDNSKRLEVGKRVDSMRENLKGIDFTNVIEESKKDLH